MPDPNLSAAIKEAYSIAPTDTVIYHTLELYHPSFVGTVIRLVRGKQAIQARLESSAPRNANSTQTFVAMAFDLTLPDQISTGLPVCKISIDNVDRALGAALDGAIIAGGKISVIYRAYLSDSLSVGPETDVEMTLLTCTLDAFKITGTAGFADLLNRSFPSIGNATNGGYYDLERFPGLAP